MGLGPRVCIYPFFMVLMCFVRLLGVGQWDRLRRRERGFSF